MKRDKETLLITGGLGFIGSNLAKRLFNKYKIVIVDLDHSKSAENTAMEFKRKGAEVIHGDIASPDTWKKIPKCQYIFHAAAQVAAEVSWKKPEVDFRTNAYGTFLVAEHARKHKAHVIYCNSIRVYDPDAIELVMKKHGKVSENCATVDASTKPQPPFAFSKFTGEQYLRYYSQMYGLNIISHRMSGIVGAGQEGSKTHGWIANLVRCAVTNKEYTIFGDGNQTRDILHVNDYLNLIEYELTDFIKFSMGGFAIYNVGGGPSNELSINDVILMLSKGFSCHLKRRRQHQRAGEPRHYATNIDLIAKNGWQSNISNANEILAELFEYYKHKQIGGN